MRSFLNLFAAVAVFSGTAAAQISQSWLDDKVASVAEDTNLIGMGAIVVTGDERLRTAWGRRAIGQDVGTTTEDLWHVGSIGKSMTATTIARLVEAGVLDWDTPLSAYLPALGERLHPEWADVTLHELLTHTSGAPTTPGLPAMFNEETDPEKLVSIRGKIITRILSAPPVTPPGDAFEYSNVGYMIASHIAETVSERPWEDILFEQLVEPLGLQTVGIGAPSGEDPLDQPLGHRRIFGIRSSVAPGPRADNPAFMSAAGTLHLSLDDLATYGQMHLKRDPSFLSASTFQRLHTPNLQNYGYGWVVQQHADMDAPLIWHNGSNTLWYAYIAVVPDHDAVIAFATNSADMDRVMPAFFNLSDVILNKLAEE